MAVYEYKAINPKGKTITGIINAESPGDARFRVKKLNYFLTSVKEVGSENTMSEGSRFFGVKNIFKWVKPQEISLFSRQMSTLLQAGLPLIDSLVALIEQFEDSGFKRVLLQVREKVNEGVSLADALAEHSRYFPPLYIGMVRSGEASGALALVLTRLAEFLEKQAELNSKIRATLAYPLIMTFVGFAILGFLFAYVIPKVTAIFEQTNQALPLPTVLLINISVILRNYWYLIILAIAAVYFILRYFINTEKGRLWFDSLKLKLPVAGSLIHKVALSRFSRTLGTMLKSGIPILYCMDIVKNVVNNKLLSNIIEEAKKDISEGKEIAMPLKRSGLFPPIVTHMIATGERSGQLEEMLLKVSESLDNETDSTIKALTSLLEPIMILIMGAMVGFIVIAILLPIFEMTRGIK